MPELVPSTPIQQVPTPAPSAFADQLERAKVAHSLGQMQETLDFLQALISQPATPQTIEAWFLAADATLELRDLAKARMLLLRAGRESGLSMMDCNVEHPSDDYSAAQLQFDVSVLRAQASFALGQGPESVWFNQATYTPDGVFGIVDQLQRRIFAIDSLGRVLWGKALLSGSKNSDANGQPSVLLSQRPDEGLSYIDNHYRDFSRLNRFANYQSLYPLGKKTHSYGSFTQDFFGNLYATCADSETIAIYTEDGTPIKEISLVDIDVPAPAIPYSILGDDEGHIYLYDTQVLVVLNRYGHPLHIHHFLPMEIPESLQTGLPGGMHMSADGKLWLVRPQERKVICVDPATNQVIATHGPALTHGDLILPVDILTDWSENLFVVDAGRGAIIRIDGDGESSILFHRPYWTGVAPEGLSPERSGISFAP